MISWGCCIFVGAMHMCHASFSHNQAWIRVAKFSECQTICTKRVHFGSLHIAGYSAHIHQSHLTLSNPFHNAYFTQFHWCVRLGVKAVACHAASFHAFSIFNAALSLSSLEWGLMDLLAAKGCSKSLDTLVSSHLQCIGRLQGRATTSPAQCGVGF